jgi:hypothetical protein
MTKRSAEQSIRDDIAYTRRVLDVLEVQRARASVQADKAHEKLVEAVRRVGAEQVALIHLEEALIALVGHEDPGRIIELEPEGEDDGSSES